MIHLWMLLWRSRKSMPQYGLSVWVKWTVCFSSVGHTCQLPGGVWKCLGQQVCVPGQAQYFSYSRAWYKLSVFLHDLHVKAGNHTTPHHTTATKRAIKGNPLTSPLLLSPSLNRVEREVYLFCYQEVITQSFSGADGPQEEDKDQIQEPPVGHQQYIM